MDQRRYIVAVNRVIAALLIVGWSSLWAQQPVQPLEVDIRGFTAPGYLLAAPLQQDTLLFIDDYGRPLFQTRAGLHANGQTYNSRYVTHFAGVGRNRFFVRRDPLLQPIDTFYVNGPGEVDFHEGKVWTDTSFILVGSHPVQMDLSKTVPGGQTDVTVVVGVIQEQTFDGRVVFEWRSIDHVPLADATADIDLTQSYIDHIHINSIWREADGNLLVSCRHTDEILKIDRNTGGIIWRFGGSASRHNEFRFLNDSLRGFVGFSHQHSVCRTSRGTILIFDNGNLKPEPIKTRVVEYRLDETSRTARAVWEFELQTAEYVKSMGSVQELANGHLMVGYGNDTGRIVAEEIDRERGVVASYRTVDEKTNNAYRAHKTTIGMVGVIDTIAGAGVIEFADRDSTTGIHLTVDSVASNVVVAAERHHFLPPSPGFSTKAPEHLFPMRLSLRCRGGDSAWRSLRGRSQIDTSIVRYGWRYDDVAWYARDTVGKGLFRPLVMTYRPATGRFETDQILRGEIIAGAMELPPPEPLCPLPDDQVAASLCVFRVSLPVGIRECIITVLNDSGTASVMSKRLLADSIGVATWYCDSLESDQSYQWHVASIGSVNTGRHSEARRFSTGSRKAEAPIPVEQPSTMNLPTGSNTVRWTTDAGAKTIIQWISPKPREGVGVGFDFAMTDTLEEAVEVTTIPTSEPGTALYWRATALADDGCLSWSDTVGFCTAPSRGQGMVPISPAIGERNVPTSNVTLRFTTSERYDQHEVLLSKGLSDALPLRKVAESEGCAVFDNLSPNTRYFWRVVEKTSYADTGALGMFVTGEVASSVETLDPRVTTVRCHDGLITVESAWRISSIRCIDALGRCFDPIVYDGTAAFSRNTLRVAAQASPIVGVWVIDERGVSTFHWIICSG